MNLPTKHSADYIKILLDKTYGNRSLTLTIFRKLFEELPEQISAIKNALDDRQYVLARLITHKLHGSVGFCGLIDLQKPACALESSLLNHDYEAANHHFLILQQGILNFIRHQTAILADLANNSEQ
jgi:HPt (histidine-containing phosphotransfer) domain-containing protein